MIIINGKYNTAKIFTDYAEEEALTQIINLLNQPFTAGSHIRIMSDVHAGKGCTIGTTMTITDKAVPNLVGVDIGCGMETVRLKERHLELQKLDKLVHKAIPAGFSIRSKPHRYIGQTRLHELYCLDHVNIDRAEKSLGTLGGGNHFIEADTNEDGAIFLVIHSGSRHLGVEVAHYYQQEAYKQLNQVSKAQVQSLIESLKAQGKQKQIQKELKKLTNIKRTDIPYELAYTEGKLFEQYMHDMKIVQEYAQLNRKAMMDELVKGMGLHIDDHFTTIHNYIDTDKMILRKGAVSAQKGEMLLIPMNMRDGSLICRGKGNHDWNYSAPHGAGRIMSRAQAKESLTLTEFRREMEGIYSTTVNRSTIDESPMAYKPMEEILANTMDTVEIIETIRPIYNFKA